MEIELPDWALAAFCFVIYVAFSLVWLFCSRQDVIQANSRTAVAIVGRIAALHGFLIAFGLLVGYDLAEALHTLPHVCVGFFISYFAFLIVKSGLGVGGPVGDDPFSVLIAAAIAASTCPFLFASAFVTGFPVRRAFERITEPQPFIEEKSVKAEPSAASVATGSQVIVTAALRPLGTVEFEGKPYPARHVGNVFVDVGESVVVCNEKNRTLLVKDIDTSPASTPAQS